MEEKRDQKIVIKVTKKEKEVIQDNAAQKGLKTSEYLRDLGKSDLANIPAVNNRCNSVEYVRLINAIDDIPDDSSRMEVSARLEVFLCH
ncbi:hypothetical protein AALA24_09340 [Anaerovoracaceae bacterium 42-11]